MISPMVAVSAIVIFLLRRGFVLDNLQDNGARYGAVRVEKRR
jgi:hypothetical protein